MSPKRPVEPAGAVDAPNAPTAPWKTHRTRFPQLPQASKSVTYVLTSQVLPMSWRRALKAGRYSDVKRHYVRPRTSFDVVTICPVWRDACSAA
jgi:hypothetical protein